MDGEIVWQCTSDGYGYRIQKSLALAYVDLTKINIKADNPDLTVEILGKHYPAKITANCNYDVKGEALKSDD